MAMIRSVIRTIPLFRSKYANTKYISVRSRSYYSHWHLDEMNTLRYDMRDEKYKDLWHRRALLGPDEQLPRSKEFLWNYDAELFAFGKRLGEDFQMSTLRRAFLHSSYKPEVTDDVEAVESEAVATTSNDEFIDIGSQVLDAYVKCYLRYHFPKLPEEGIRTVAAYLCSEKQLAYLANNLGMFDLTLASDFPYGEQTMANTFKAVVGALKVDSGEQKAEYFVQDFVLTELADLDINELFYVKNPMRILTAICEKSGMGSPDARILRQTGTFSVTPTYVIGVYVNKQLLGQSPGESSQIAEEMAARDCLKTLWDTNMERRLPLAFGSTAGRALNLASWKDRENESLRKFIDFGDDTDLLGNAFDDEPFNLDEMHARFKEEIEPTLGRTYRRVLKHAFYHGTPIRHPHRSFIKPNVKTI